MAIIYDENGTAGKVCSICRNWKPLVTFSTDKGRRGDGYRYRCKVCDNIEQTDHRAEARGKYNDYQRAWREANADKVKASVLKYQEANRKKISDAARERRNANLEEHRARGRAQHAKHREKRNANSKEYRKTHRWIMAAQLNRRRARKLRAEGSHTIEEWENLKAYYAYTCLRCGRREPEIALTRDHVVPLSEGGSDDIGNLQPLCFSCNSSKGAKTIDYRADWRADQSKAD